MAPVGFEPTISVGERPQTYALDREATVDRPHIWAQTPVEMWWHTVTHGRENEGETGECSG